MAYGSQPCWKCQFPDQRNTSQPYWRWRCTFITRPVPIQNVTDQDWLADDPHPTCQDVNAFDQCRFFAERVDAELEES